MFAQPKMSKFERRVRQHLIIKLYHANKRITPGRASRLSVERVFTKRVVGCYLHLADITLMIPFKTTTNIHFTRFLK